MNGHHRFDLSGNHARGLVQQKTFEKILLGPDNNLIFEYEFQSKVKPFFAKVRLQ